MNTVELLSGASMEMFRAELSGLHDKIAALEETYRRTKDQSIDEDCFDQSVPSLVELVDSVREVMLSLQRAGGMSLCMIPVNAQSWRNGVEQARREQGIAKTLELERQKRAAAFAEKEREEQDKLERLRRGEIV